MPLLDEIASRLSSQGVGIVGTSLFKGHLPDSTGLPDPHLGLVEYAASPALRVSGPSGAVATLAERPRLQILVRGTDYATTRTRALAVITALDWLGRITLTASSGGGTDYQHIEVLQRPPLMLGRDVNDRWRWAVNIEATRSPGP